MLVTLKDGDSLAVTIHGETHVFGPAEVTVRRDETSTRSGDKTRYLTVTIPLAAGEFPETTSHMNGA